jgi:bifunctional DNA-binding transcriptional regulator/antitoxin component of YhaV-PrlF toxin-antitoxin module
MEVFHTRIEANGKIQIPPQVLEKLNLETGQEVEIEVERRTLRVSSTKLNQRREAQKFVKSRFGTKKSAVDEFIEERRQEALND